MDLPMKKRPSAFTIADILEDHCQKSNENGFDSDEEDSLRLVKEETERIPTKVSSTVQQQSKFGKNLVKILHIFFINVIN